MALRLISRSKFYIITSNRKSFKIFSCRDDNSFYFQHQKTADGTRIDNYGAKVKLFEQGDHQVNLNTFGSRTRQKRQTKFGQTLEYKNARGFGGSIGYENIPEYNYHQNNANIFAQWESDNKRTNIGADAGIKKDNFGNTDWNAKVGIDHAYKQTTFDANAQIMRHNNEKPAWGANIGLTHRF